MAGLSPKLPVQRDPDDGFALTQTYEEMIRQNFKNLVLTSPGERMMDPDFGVGIRRYLFELNNEETYSYIEERIDSQVATYLPFIEVRKIEFYPNYGTDMIDTMDIPDNYSNQIGIRITYFVMPLGVFDALEVEISMV